MSDTPALVALALLGLLALADARTARLVLAAALGPDVQAAELVERQRLLPLLAVLPFTLLAARRIGTVERSEAEQSGSQAGHDQPPGRDLGKGTGESVEAGSVHEDSPACERDRDNGTEQSRRCLTVTLHPRQANE
jgi:hypothetical protein